MTYQEQQKALFDKLEADFKKGETPVTLVSPVDDFSSDSRLTLTAVCFANYSIQKKIFNELVIPLRHLDERQFYYNPAGLHFTIKHIIRLADPPRFTKDHIKKCQRVLSRVVGQHKSFEVNFCGLFELPTSCAVRGYSSDLLGELVLDLRKELGKVGIPEETVYAS